MPRTFESTFLQVASTFGIPVVKPDGKRKREDHDMPLPAPRLPFDDDQMGGELMRTLTKSVEQQPMTKKAGKEKKTGRMGSRFQNQKLVRAINVRPEHAC